jgi:hypothetical protein
LGDPIQPLSPIKGNFARVFNVPPKNKQIQGIVKKVLRANNCPISVALFLESAIMNKAKSLLYFIELLTSMMNKYFQTTLALLIISVSFTSLSAQTACVEVDGEFRDPTTGGPCVNTVVSAVPFLRITPDARGGAMGDAGVALSADANAIHYNASRLAFAEEDFSVGATYTPWLQALGLNDVYLAYLSGYKKIGDLQAVSGSLRYFSLGDIQYTDENAQPLGTGKPNEFELAAAYARKLTDRFSGSLTLKYINSNLAAGQQVGSDILEVGQSFAGDIGMTYRNDKIRTKSGAPISVPRLRTLRILFVISSPLTLPLVQLILLS